MRLKLLGGPADEFLCTLIETDEDVERHRVGETGLLRAEAKRLHAVWLAEPTSLQARWAFAGALLAWAQYVGDRWAWGHACRLMEGRLR